MPASHQQVLSQRADSGDEAATCCAAAEASFAAEGSTPLPPGDGSMNVRARLTSRSGLDSVAGDAVVVVPLLRKRAAE